jgi:molybdate transport system substrate-binding protein
MSITLQLLCAGAAQGLVTALAETVRERLDLVTAGRFGAVGSMRDAFNSGEPCDVFVSTQSMIESMIAEGSLAREGFAPLGGVSTGVGVPAGCSAPPVDTPEALAAALDSASSIWLPDMVKSTAGQHVARVLEALGIRERIDGRIRMFPNGATAMREMVASGDRGAIGITQASEILFTPGASLIDLLPARFELTTVYSAAVAKRSERPSLAGEFIALLISGEQDELARRCGFVR